MVAPARRTLLCATAGLFPLAAGCLDDTGLASSDTDGADTDDTDGDDPTAPDDTASDDDDTYDTVSFSHADVLTEPEATFLGSATRAERWLDTREFDDEQPLEFVDGTDFEDSVLLALEADAPRLDYELALETVTVAHEADSEPQLVVVAAVNKRSSESDGFGGTQMITVGQLVRATFDGEPGPSAAVTIVDSDGQKHSTEIAPDTESESASDSERDDGTAHETA